LALRGYFCHVLALQNKNSYAIGASLNESSELRNDETLSRFALLWAGDESMRDSIIEGNMHWVIRLAEAMDNRSDIPVIDLIEAGKAGLTLAVDAFKNPEFVFAPDHSLKGGYAIWWVMMKFFKLANARGYHYNAGSNSISGSLAS
jgi:DNA-directed RNA polymerase sigma subunit (sigma70/sigma32)